MSIAYSPPPPPPKGHYSFSRLDASTATKSANTKHVVAAMEGTYRAAVYNSKPTGPRGVFKRFCCVCTAIYCISCNFGPEEAWYSATCVTPTCAPFNITSKGYFFGMCCCILCFRMLIQKAFLLTKYQCVTRSTMHTYQRVIAHCRGGHRQGFFKP